MIYSRSAEYAVRAFVHLASAPDGRYVMAKNVAAAEAIPAHFLAKILQQLVRRGFLRSSKGPTGGFALKKAANRISLYEVAVAVDGSDHYDRCLCGSSECNESAACGLHDGWSRMRSSIIKYMEGTSIADVSASLEQKRMALARRTKSRRTPAKSGSSANGRKS
jgi:Rrf2 family protein